MGSKDHPWFRPTRYWHFDWPVGSAKAAEQLVASTHNVASHSFLPFIGFDIVERRYKRDLRRTVNKIRPISLPGHADSAIYRYYNSILSERYETRLRASIAHQSVIGYRRLGGKCNIHLAHEAFLDIRKRGACIALALDVEQFFPSIPHAALKQSWSSLLDRSDLPPDHYKIYRSLTRYAEVDRFSMLSALGLRQFQLRGPPRPLCTPFDFRTKIRGAGLITTHSASVGIPQGSPMSATLSNIALMTVDEHLAKWSHAHSALYLRYADDVLLVVNPDLLITAESVLLGAFAGAGYTINDDKMDVVHFGLDGKAIEGPLQYLGFVFDGSRILVRGKTLARYQRNMKAGAFMAVKAAMDASLSMSKTCPKCKGKGKVWRWDVFDMSNLANGYWETCPRCSGGCEVADDEEDDEEDDDEEESDSDDEESDDEQ